jgi:hypothetical protein
VKESQAWPPDRLPVCLLRENKQLFANRVRHYPLGNVGEDISSGTILQIVVYIVA